MQSLSQHSRVRKMCDGKPACYFINVKMGHTLYVKHHAIEMHCLQT